MKLRYIALGIIILLIFVGYLFFSSSENLLRNSIIKGNLPKVQRLLEKNPQLANATIKQHAKGRGPYQISVLCFALQNRQPEIAKELLLAGADPIINPGRINLLSYPAREGYIDLIPLLIQKGADPNIEKQNWVYLPLACPKDVETAQVLLDNGADVNARNAEGQTPLHGLATFGDIEIARLVIKNGADVNAKDNLGCTPLHRASCECLPEKVQLLIDNGADINAQDNKGRNALRRTIEERSDSHFGLDRPTYYDTLKILIDKGCDADMGDYVFAGDLVWLKEKIERDPELIHTYKFHRQPLLVIAIAHGHDDIVKYLIEQGADIHITGPYDNPLLHTAVYAGNPETVKILINEGFDVNQKGLHGELPLHWVSRMANFQPYRSEGKYDQIAQFLIDAGSELDTKATQAWNSMDTGIEGEKPIEQVSHYLRNTEIRRTSQRYQLIASPQLAFNVGDTPLHSAARWGRIEIVNMLIEAGAQIDPKNALNQTPLHYAVVYQYPEVVKALLKAGADPTIKTNKEMDAFRFSEVIDDPVIISLLKEKKL